MLSDPLIDNTWYLTGNLPFVGSALPDIFPEFSVK